MPHSLDGELVLGCNLVIDNYGEVPGVAGALRAWKVRVVRCGWFGAGEIGPVRTQYQLGSFASVRSGIAQLCQTNIADGANCRYTPQKGLCAISAGGGEIGRYSGVSGPTEADGRFLSIHF